MEYCISWRWLTGTLHHVAHLVMNLGAPAPYCKHKSFKSKLRISSDAAVAVYLLYLTRCSLSPESSSSQLGSDMRELQMECWRPGFMVACLRPNLWQTVPRWLYKLHLVAANCCLIIMPRLELVAQLKGNTAFYLASCISFNMGWYVTFYLAVGFFLDWPVNS
jgi:hypothetical protein